ncbi:MAG: acryloyl-CoA reductase, partial [Pseudomonadota bacterium]
MSETFKALVVEKDEDGTSAGVQDLTLADLPEAEVTVAVEYSTVNYKDGLCVGPGGGLVRKYPHVPGIDFAGTVETSSDDRYAPGDKVVLTGWRVGEAHWGGYSQKARVKADWLVPLPDGLTTRQAMAVGTAGFTSMLAVQALEDRGFKAGPVLVTGAAGGVGSVAVALLHAMGQEVAAVTGRPEQEEYLRGLGASQIVPRADLAETVKKPLEGETWGGCVDAVGGAMLARVLGQME